MNRRHLLALSTASLLAGLSGRRAAAAMAGAGDPSIVVGVLATMTGPQALDSLDVADGFSLAVRQLAQRFANQEVRVVLADDKGLPDVARQVVGRLLERERVDVVLAAVSPASLVAVLPLLIEARIFVLNAAPMPVSLAGAGCSMWLFDLAGTADAVHEAAGLQMNIDKVRKVAVCGLDIPSTHDATVALKRTFTGEIVGVVQPHHGATSFTDELARLRKLAPDAVYDLLTGGVGVEFVRAWGDAGLKATMPLYAPWTGFERVTLPAMGDAALDATTIGTWAADLDTPLNRRMVGEYETDYGRPATSWAAHGYDAAMLLDAALKLTKGHTADHDLLRNALRHAEFPSVRGTFHFAPSHAAILTWWARHIGHDAKGRLTNETRAMVVKDWRGNTSACPMRWEDAPLFAPPPVKAPGAH
jgi:branched-chain amino acid transport system substrate-binding protein